MKEEIKYSKTHSKNIILDLDNFIKSYLLQKFYIFGHL